MIALIEFVIHASRPTVDPANPGPVELLEQAFEMSVTERMIAVDLRQPLDVPLPMMQPVTEQFEPLVQPYKRQIGRQSVG